MTLFGNSETRFCRVCMSRSEALCVWAVNWSGCEKDGVSEGDIFK